MCEDQSTTVDMENTSPKNIPTKNQPRRSARLSGKLDDTEKPKNVYKEFPTVAYKGVIKYYTDYFDIAASADELTKWVESQGEVVPISFDMEWPFSFQTGPERSSLIQISMSKETCFLYQLTNIKKMPSALITLLSHPKVFLYGVNIKSDIRKLKRDFPEITAEETMITNCIDLGVMCNKVCSTGTRWSLDRLSQFICKMTVDKNSKIRHSKWNVIPLSDQQKLYAATDVYIGQLIYEQLKEMEVAKQNREAEFLQNNGEKAMEAVKQLGMNFVEGCF